MTVLEPEIIGETPAAGLIVSVFTALAAAMALITIGNISPVRSLYEASVRLKTTGPLTQPALYAATALLSVGKSPPAPTVYVPLNGVITVMITLPVIVAEQLATFVAMTLYTPPVVCGPKEIAEPVPGMTGPMLALST